MEPVLSALRHLRVHLVHIYEDLERAEAVLTSGCQKDCCMKFSGLADHVRDLEGHLNAALAQVNLFVSSDSGI